MSSNTNSTRTQIMKEVDAADLVDAVAKIDKLTAGTATPTETDLEKFNRYRVKYVTAISPSGRLSLHNGDGLAGMLELKPLDLVKALVDRFTVKSGDQYNHLNVGQQRMTLGNLLRGALRRGEMQIEDVAEFIEVWMTEYEAEHRAE
ncbi:hypothetical protein A3758_04235 [Oleiphilus sp. HI0118]|nr:hypothetical protein A3758_04235 [Oleiphilus sp. HI0118]KZZ80888.1 hypothetical protein A3767_09150 [Oleiphilus sp. HI0133]